MRKINKQKNVIYHEIQRPRQIWVWLLILFFDAFIWYVSIQQIFFGAPFGHELAPNVMMGILWLIFGIILPLFFLVLLKLITEVRNDGLYVRFVPFHIHYRQFLFKDILQCDSIVYSPLKRFGGWGVRINSKGEVAYNMNGNQGLELKMRNHIVVIGSQDSDELKSQLDSAKDKNT